MQIKKTTALLFMIFIAFSIACPPPAVNTNNPDEFQDSIAPSSEQPSTKTVRSGSLPSSSASTGASIRYANLQKTPSANLQGLYLNANPSTSFNVSAGETVKISIDVDATSQPADKSFFQVVGAANYLEFNYGSPVSTTFDISFKVPDGATQGSIRLIISIQGDLGDFSNAIVIYITIIPKDSTQPVPPTVQITTTTLTSTTLTSTQTSSTITTSTTTTTVTTNTKTTSTLTTQTTITTITSTTSSTSSTLTSTTTTLLPDFENTMISSPDSYIYSINSSVDIRIDNYGALTSGVDYEIYISMDDIIDPGDFSIASGNIPGINAGSFFNGPIGVTYPPLPAGVYYIGMIVDPGDTVLESDELNNTTLNVNTYSISTAIIIFNSGVTNDGNYATHSANCNSAYSSLMIPGMNVQPMIATTGNSMLAIPVPAAGYPVLSPTGLQVSISWSGLWDSAIDMSLSAAGVLPPASEWYSGADFNGNVAMTCSDWTNNGGGTFGGVGLSDAIDSDWVYFSDDVCSVIRYYLCVAY